MAHYAFLDENNIVVEVIVGKDEEDEGVDWEDHYGKFRNMVCKRTSFNTLANTHLKGGTPFRKNYAGIGYRYDEELDAFIPPQPYPSWVLDQDACQWGPPIPYPENTNSEYVWNEDLLNWEAV